MDGQTLLNINGKSIGVKFNLYGLEEARKIKGNLSVFKNILAQIWGGIQGYAFAKQTEPDISFEELIDWLDKVQLSGDPDKEIEKIEEAFQSSLIYEANKAVEEKTAEVAEEEKKNQPLATSES